MNAREQIEFSQSQNPNYESESDDVRRPTNPAVKLFAFYLPQFHPIPENDSWWGKGFTEWTNVTRGMPRFAGHFQPRLPADLGFYDLRLVETLQAQCDLAKRYGITGFCFHWYWFGGKRLLDKPLNLLLANPSIDMPFFINWANENWTRAWDGFEKSILMEQKYGDEEDIALADAFLALTADSRYIRVNGRPLIMLYNPAKMPDAARTVACWRSRFREMNEQDPYVLMPHRFDDADPRPYGIDAVVQYPPHNVLPPMAHDNINYRLFDPAYRGLILDYEKVADRLMSIKSSQYQVIRGLSPGWDNEARKPGSGTTLTGSTPRKYGAWLARACQVTITDNPPALRFILINAWNEWAEGAYLEPDRHFGHAYLRETARVLTETENLRNLDIFIADRDRRDGNASSHQNPILRFLTKARRKISRSISRKQA